MSKPRELWWPFVKNVIRAYPRLHKDLQALRDMPMTANYNGMPGGGGSEDPVMQAALRTLSSQQDQKYHDAVETAISQTLGMRDGNRRIAIIRAVYWDKTHTVAGAGRKEGYQDTAAVMINGDFCWLVAENLGVADKKQRKKRKCVSQSQKNVVQS